jgi:hypothetical protein
MTGADDTHTDPDRADAVAAPADGAEMTDEEFAAAAAARDARAMAAAMPGVVVIQVDLDDFVREMQARQQEMARREADPRTADQMRAEVGVLLQRFYDARWYGNRDDMQRTGQELGRALRETQYQISVPAEFIAHGAYVRAVGRDPGTGRPASVSGIVDEATYTSRREPGRGTGAEYGVHFVVTPPQRDGHRSASYEVFVHESVPLIQLPAPVDRGRPSWMEHRGTTASLGNAAGVASPSPALAGAASESAEAVDKARIRGARPFPPPGRIDPALSPPTPAAAPAAPDRDRHRSPRSAAANPSRGRALTPVVRIGTCTAPPPPQRRRADSPEGREQR